VVLTANNADKDEINGKIRAILAETGIVQHGTVYEMFQKHDINNIAKTFGRAYTDGQVIITRRDCGNIPRGTQATITKVDVDNDTINVKYYDKKTLQPVYADIDLRQNAVKFDVYNRHSKRFGAGDGVIFTKNDKHVGVSNGQTGTITEIDSDGNAKIQVGNKTIECNLHNRGDKGYTYIDYAYCLTNHKSQGSTYDKVIVNADVSQQKTNYNAFYVQATRARYDITIITDNRDKLAEQAAVRENKISTLDDIFDNFARQQQSRAADVRAADAEFNQNAEKADRDRIEAVINAAPQDKNLTDNCLRIIKGTKFTPEKMREELALAVNKAKNNNVGEGDFFTPDDRPGMDVGKDDVCYFKKKGSASLFDYVVRRDPITNNPKKRS